MIHATVTRSLAVDTADFIQQAQQEGNQINLELGGRILLLGTASIGIAEMISRMALFTIAQFVSFFTLFQSDSLNNFTKDQVKLSIAATAITVASLFSLLSPTVFASTQLAEEARHERQIQLIERMAQENRWQAQIIADAVQIPFAMVGFMFQIPFYFMYLTFQIAILPIRIALLPLQILFCPCSSFAPRPRFELF
jgi:hypothetical protein